MDNYSISKEVLEELYIKQRLSVPQVANYLGVSKWTINDRLKRFEIPIHRNENIYELTELQKEVLDGIMLGDGCLYKPKASPNQNAQLIYLSKSEQHVKFVGQYFENILSDEGYTYRKIFDKRTNKYYEQNKFRTIHCTGLTEQYKRWYPNGKKIIPNDLILTPLKCLMWYIRDGSISLNGSHRTQAIRFSTDCFEIIQQETILIPQLQNFNAVLYKSSKNKQGKTVYNIRIPHKSIRTFLEYIGECPFLDYTYKWKFKPYILKPFEVKWKHLENTFCDLYKQGYTYYKIAKMYGCTPNAVRHYLIANEIYKERSN